MRLLERLELRDLARRAGRRRLRGAASQSAIARVLAPLGQHERVDLQCSSDRVDLQSRLLTEPDGGQLKLVAVLPDRPGP